MVLVRQYKVEPASQTNSMAHRTKHKSCKTRLTQGLLLKSMAVSSSKFIPCNAKGKILSANKYSHNVYKPILAWLSLKNICGELKPPNLFWLDLFYLRYFLYWSDNKYAFDVLQNRTSHLSKWLYFI